MTSHCVTCGKDFSGDRYYRCHLAYNKKCKHAYDNQVATPPPKEKRPRYEPDAVARLPKSSTGTGEKVVSPELMERALGMIQEDKQARKQLELGESCGEVLGKDTEFSEDTQTNQEEAHDGQNSDMEEENLMDQVDQDSAEEEEDREFDTEMLDQFVQYTQWASNNLLELNADEKAAVELLGIMNKRRVPLAIYDEIIQWHIKHAEATTRIPRQNIIEHLNKRYNMEGKLPFTKKMELPSSHAKVDLVCHDAKHAIQSLLTDARISDEDYLFFEDDPFAPPPADFTVVGDVNTGRCYRETWKSLVKNPKKDVPLGLVLYMDGAITGQNDHLPIEALKMTLAIFKNKTRNKAFAWRTLGYVAKFLKEASQAEVMLQESGHADLDFYMPDSDSDGEGVPEFCKGSQNSVSEDESSSDDDSESDNEDDHTKPEKCKIPECNAQDLHSMLEAMLESYQKLQDSGGFEWNLRYKGKTHRVNFIPFIMMIKGDSVEHDKHCGHYTIRTKDIKQLCRYCCVPNAETDEPYKDHKRKSPAMIQKLVDNQDVEGLRLLSQQNLHNSWYPLLFGLHNDLGVHGACLLEILHWFQLGQLKYLRGMFFEQLGKTTKVSNLFNVLCKTMGLLLGRQSDRELPRTRFSKGVKKGKLMAHEMSGVILVMLAAISTKKGQQILLNTSTGKAKANFATEGHVQDWSMLMETTLQFEAWMKQPEIRVYDIRRLKTKVREYMAMQKHIGRRKEGMQFKTFNFHASLHVAQDMLDFGVPANMDTMSNEMHHKPTKTAALRTQRRMKTFDLQCGTQVHNMEVVEMAMAEINTDNKQWEYFRQTEEEQEILGYEEPMFLTGTQVIVTYNPEEEEEAKQVEFKAVSRMKNKNKFLTKFCENRELMDFIKKVLKEQLYPEVNILSIYTEHIRDGQIFRASPYYLGRAWRDWVMVDWGKPIGILPAHVWCFVDLLNIPEGACYDAGIYAIIESSIEVVPEPEKENKEEKLPSLFVPYTKETNGPDRKFYMIQADAFHSPTVMIPDLGNEDKNAFLRLHPRIEWGKQFVSWLTSEHTRNFNAED